jgi:DNA polymerase III catalytic subunit, DnaE type
MNGMGDSDGPPGVFLYYNEGKTFGGPPPEGTVEMMGYIHLDTYSAYTLLEGTIPPERLATEAKRRGFRAIGLCDQNVLYGAIPFYQACRKEGIVPVLGMRTDVRTSPEEGGPFPLLLFAKSFKGYQNLMKLSTFLQTENPDGVPLERLQPLAGDLLAVSPGRTGEVDSLLSAGSIAEAEKRARFYSNLFDGAFYLSVHWSDRGNPRFLRLMELSEKTGIPVIPAHPVRFLEPDDYDAWKSLEAIRLNVPISEVPRLPEENQFYLKPAEEMEDLFRWLPEGLEQLDRLVEECRLEIPFHNRLLPKYPVPGGEDADQYLARLCREGLTKRLGQPKGEYIKRLDYELDIIRKMKFSDYFLIVWDFVKYAKDSGMMVGPGRGSAAGSLVAYVLGITDVDPIRYDLLFERFLNPERVTMPDIDIDFPDHRRDEVIRYVAEKYGKTHVAQIITFGTFAAKAALRDVARVNGFSGEELSRLSRAIPSRPGMTLEAALEQSEDLQNLLREEKYRRIFDMAQKIEGLPRHTSTHAAGVVISGKPLSDLIPLQQSTSDLLQTQYPMGTLEELGLLKMDFLGLRNLSLMENILQEIRQKEGKSIHIKSIPFDDEPTYRLLREGRTTGVFQLESEGIRNVLKKLKPTHFEDIVAVVALYRPGPMANIPQYIQRKHGQQPVVYPHPDLAPILEKTYGVIIYQEQIMQIASRMAGFTLGEADLLRRAVSKKKRDLMDQERIHFVSGAKRMGYEEETAQRIYDLIVRFADYGFNRSHAVAYSLIAYQMAYLKAHYPLYFLAALLTSVIGNEEKIKEYVRELRQMGYSIKGPSINKSHFRFQVEDDGIRFSLAAIKGVGVQALKEILQARKERPFTDLFDFCLRVSPKVVNRKTMEHLIHSGSFDEFGQDRAVLLATLDAAIDHAHLMRTQDGQLVFGGDSPSFRAKYIDAGPIPVDAKLQYEKQVLGMFLSLHPATLARDVFYFTKSRFLENLEPNQKGRAVVYISDDRKIRTRNGEPMCFLTISDESLELAAVAFPNVYRRFSKWLKKGETVVLDGGMEKRGDQLQFVIERVVEVEEVRKEMSGIRLFIRIPRDVPPSVLFRMKEILLAHAGKTPVILRDERRGKTIQLDPSYWVNSQSDGPLKLAALLGRENVVLK